MLKALGQGGGGVSEKPMKSPQEKELASGHEPGEHQF